MNKELIRQNLEVVRIYLGKNGCEFSTMFGKEKSYYSAILKRNTLPSIDFMLEICKYLNIRIDQFLNEKLKLKLMFEEEDIQENEEETNE